MTNKKIQQNIENETVKRNAASAVASAKTAERLFNGYHQIIHEVTNRTDTAELDLIEDCLRRDVFHSTLDWQPRDLLARGIAVAETVLIQSGELSPQVVMIPHKAEEFFK